MTGYEFGPIEQAAFNYMNQTDKTTVDPNLKVKIKELLSQVVVIENKDEAPYKLVVDQHKIKSDLKAYYSLLAANKLTVMSGSYVQVSKHDVWGLETDTHSLVAGQCEYDDWQVWIKLFEGLGSKVTAWSGKYSEFPTILWDVSQDPDFEHAPQKVFSFTVQYYNAHIGGF